MEILLLIRAMNPFLAALACMSLGFRLPEILLGKNSSPVLVLMMSAYIPMAGVGAAVGYLQGTQVTWVTAGFMLLHLTIIVLSVWGKALSRTRGMVWLRNRMRRSSLGLWIQEHLMEETDTSSPRTSLQAMK